MTKLGAGGAPCYGNLYKPLPQQYLQDLDVGEVLTWGAACIAIFPGVTLGSRLMVKDCYATIL